VCSSGSFQGKQRVVNESCGQETLRAVEFGRTLGLLLWLLEFQPWLNFSMRVTQIMQNACKRQTTTLFYLVGLSMWEAVTARKNLD
jgi:hypothetical protein